MKKTSFHSGGFWFHITWDKKGNGVDQHNRMWSNPEKPICDSVPYIGELCHMMGTVINESFKLIRK